MRPDDHAQAEREARRREAQRDVRERHLAGADTPPDGAPSTPAAEDRRSAMQTGMGAPGMTMWLRLGVMTVLSFIAMYVAMYAMVNTWDDVFINVNKGYMAALMTAPMVIIELGVMTSMYPRRGRVVAIAIASVVILFSFNAIRQQQLVGEDQFLRSMIPHHSAAILMCREASLADAETRDLCTRIIQSQQEEIDEMNAIMARLAQ